jgi:hypothetical protein
MYQRNSVSAKCRQSAALDALIELVRLLARQAAWELVVRAPTPPEKQKQLQPDGSK